MLNKYENKLNNIIIFFSEREKMKTNFKSIILVAGFMVLSNGIFAASTIDPDAAVYNALTNLGFATGKSTLPSAITSLTSPTDTIFTTYVSMLTNAMAFYTSDGKTAPTTTPLSTYYTMQTLG